MPDTKKYLLQARLQNRVIGLGMPNFDAYGDYVFRSGRGAHELENMIDAVTTHKTDFFRHPDHFAFLNRTVLPDVLSRRGSGKKFRLWCAGCSTGEEAYTLAMVLAEYADAHQPFRFGITATDISKKVLAHAEMGVYAHERIYPIPLALRTKFLRKGKGEHVGKVRFAPELRATIRFQKLNLLKDHYEFQKARDVIFCRNVMIYFDAPVREAVLTRLCRHLRPGGYLFLGTAALLQTEGVPIRRVAPGIYQKCL